MPFMTFNEMLSRTAWRLPDKTFLYWSDKNRSLTYAEGDMISDKVAGLLAALGVEKGDRVGLLAHNGLDYVMTMFGTWKLGAISTHINVLLADQLNYYVNDSQPKVLVYTGDMHSVVEQAKSEMTSVQHYICYDGARNGAHDWTTLLAAAPNPPPSKVSGDDKAHLSYTSGTSGKPKGAVLAHGPTARATNCIAERLGLSSKDISFGPTSLASSYHLVANLLPGIHRGATIGLRANWDADVAWQEMDNRAVTLFAANPPLLTEILEVSRGKERGPHSLRVAVSGGAPVPPDLKQAYFDELDVYLVESYGQSELGGFVALGYPHREADRLAAIGPPLPDKEVRIVDTSDNEVPIGEPGEMVLRGGFMVGYWNMPDKTEEAIRDGWLHTGDMGRMDSEGYISMLGRWSERIEQAGQVIFPRAMEEVLYRHPAVKYAAVIGKPDPAVGEIPKAIVALHPQKKATADELMAFCHSQLGEKRSPSMIQIISEMPMTPTGKTNKAELQRRERS